MGKNKYKKTKLENTIVRIYPPNSLVTVGTYLTVTHSNVKGTRAFEGPSPEFH